MSSAESVSKNKSNGKKVLLSTIGSRGDVQPMIALALELKQLGHHPILAAGPNFRDFVGSFGIDFSAYGPDLTERDRWLREMSGTVDERKRDDAYFIQNAFEATYEVAKECDMILVGGGFHHAGRSIAEALKIPFVCALYCAAVVPSLNYPPACMKIRYREQSQRRPKSVNKALWKTHEWQQNDRYMDLINAQRGELGLSPIKNVHRHIISDKPWLVADKILGPATSSADISVNQVGPLLLENNEPLPDNVEAFLQNGPPPIYIGFGSMLYAGKLKGGALVEACRLSGYRAIIYRGWADLDVPIDDENILAITDINQSKLFPRVAAVVHHGGAGTTTAAAIAGVTQLIVPNCFDQFYWGDRIRELGIGFACRSVYTISVDSLVEALRELITIKRANRALEVSKSIDVHGTQNTAKLIDTMLS